jgi:hypothetical protein
LERWEWHVLIGRFWFSPAYYQYIQKTCMIWVYVDYEMKPIPYSISPVQQATAFRRRHSGQFTYIFAQSPCHGRIQQNMWRILDTLPKQW